MQEYSRKAATAESRLEELHKRAVYHDDHIRVVDAWWRQVIEEIELLVDASVPADASNSGKNTTAPLQTLISLLTVCS